MSLVGKAVSFLRRFPAIVCQDEWLDVQDRFCRILRVINGVLVVETLFVIDGRPTLFTSAAILPTEVTGIEE